MSEDAPGSAVGPETPPSRSELKRAGQATGDPSSFQSHVRAARSEFESQIERARIELGLDKPLIVQYKRYMEKLLQADMGISMRTHRPVFQDLEHIKLPVPCKQVLIDGHVGDKGQPLLMVSHHYGVPACIPPGQVGSLDGGPG